MKKHFQGTGIVSPLDGVVQLHEKNSPQSQTLLTQRRMMLDFLWRLGRVILIRNASVWPCQETSKICQYLSNFEATREDRANSGRTNESSRFPWNFFSNISRLNMWRGGGGCLRTLDNLPGWSYGAVNSAIFEYYTKVARNPRSLLEPWRMSANDYQVHIYFSTYNIYIYICMYIIFYTIYR